MKPAVSVIVPVYNVAAYLPSCLDSLVSQTLQSIEILIINDGSPDNSQEIIDEYAARYPDIITSFRKENGGLSDARNFGLEHANGQYIAFVDSDDVVSADMLQDMYSLAQKHRAEIVICNLKKVDEHGNILQLMPQLPQLPERIELAEEFSPFADLSYFACNKIFKASLFKNKRFLRGCHFEDIQLIPQLLLECATIAHTNEYHYHYLERSGSISRTHTEKGADILRAVQDVEKAFLNSKYKNKTQQLKNFQILEGVYTFLAYTAFIQDKQTAAKMNKMLAEFREKNRISLSEILLYRRFGKNYLLSLPPKKVLYYLFCFAGLQSWLQKIMRKA